MAGVMGWGDVGPAVASSESEVGGGGLPGTRDSVSPRAVGEAEPTAFEGSCRGQSRSQH